MIIIIRFQQVAYRVARDSNGTLKSRFAGRTLQISNGYINFFLIYSHLNSQFLLVVPQFLCLHRLQGDPVNTTSVHKDNC